MSPEPPQFRALCQGLPTRHRSLTEGLQYLLDPPILMAEMAVFVPVLDFGWSEKDYADGRWLNTVDTSTRRPPSKTEIASWPSL
jgi:hypothetical protein